MLGLQPISSRPVSSNEAFEVVLDLLVAWAYESEFDVRTTADLQASVGFEYRHVWAIAAQIVLDAAANFEYQSEFTVEAGMVVDLLVELENRWEWFIEVDYDSGVTLLDLSMMPHTRTVDMRFSRDEDTLTVTLLPGTRAVEA